MIRLRGAHRGERAVVMFGGPSLLAAGFDFSRLSRAGFVSLLETKALTPGFIASGGRPDYYLALFPEKTKDNTLQHFIYRSFLAQKNIDPLLAPASREVSKFMREHFDEYLEPWRPHRGPHKRFRYRPDVFLPDSPYELLAKIPDARIIANRTLQAEHYPGWAYGDRTYHFEQDADARGHDVESYFNPEEREGRVLLRGGGTFFNSAAIALYPLLNYLGFKEAYFLGMDMSILGSLEYAAPYTFRSMAHFWWFWHRNGRVFNGNFQANGWLFKRPQSEFNDLRMLWARSPVTFTRVYDPWKHASRIDDIRTISMDQFLRM